MNGYKTPSQISRETYIKADNETYRALTFDLLTRIYERLDKGQKSHEEQVRLRCGPRFEAIERSLQSYRVGLNKRSSLFGFIGGFVAVLAMYLRDWLMK